MSLSTATLRTQLAAVGEICGQPNRVLLAWSGGRDSTVLLHLMSRWAKDTGNELIALHVNHGLQNGADAWQALCEAQAREFGVALQCFRVEVGNEGLGLEASARKARYATLQSAMEPGDWLLTAHHQDDQAETVLLNLLRGSGIPGLRGAAACRRLGTGFLIRPLLNVAGQAIADYAAEHSLAWIDDPSNADQQFDRNYLRGTVLPVLQARWPQAARSLTRSAAHATEAALLLDELAHGDIDSCGSAERLSISAMRALSAARQRNLVRTACRILHVQSPPYHQMHAIQNELLNARCDASPLVIWPGGEARRYRDYLYLMATTNSLSVATGLLSRDRPRAPLAGHQGVLSLNWSDEGGIREAAVVAGLQLRFRAGGERIQLAGNGRRRRLKSLFQEAGVVPWMRDRIPLLFAGEELVAVGDLWIAAEYHAPCGFSVTWEQKPALF